jgi:hypothetical protein
MTKKNKLIYIMLRAKGKKETVPSGGLRKGRVGIGSGAEKQII